MQTFLAIWLCGLCSIEVSAQTTETVNLPDAEVNSDYGNKNVSVLKVSGGIGNINWTAVRPADLPDGITIDAQTGQLKGTPTTAQDVPYNFRVKVCDSGGTPKCYQQQYSLKVNSTMKVVALFTPEPKSPPPTKWYEQSRTNTQRAVNPKLNEAAANSNSDELTITVAMPFRKEDEVAPSTPGSSAAITIAEVIDFKTGLLGTTKYPANQAATLLINALLTYQEELQDKDYCVVHIVNWSETAGGKFESNDRWYHFQSKANGEQLEWVKQPPPPEGNDPRIYGSQRVAALLIHLNARDTWDIKYDVKSTGKIPTPIQNLLELAGALKGASADTANTVNLWGGQLLININKLPADVAFAGKTTFTNSAGKATQEAKPWNKTFDNEKRYHWDVSVGIPFTKLRQLDYEFRTSDGKPSGFVSRQDTTRQDAYAFLNLYPVAVDLKSSEWWKTPHLVVGLPFRKKTFDSPMVGVGIGSYQSWLKVNFFAGAVFNKVTDTNMLQPGDATTQPGFDADRRERRVTKLIFGLNFPISQLKYAFTKK